MTDETPVAPLTAGADDSRIVKGENLVLDELSNRLDSLKLFREDDPARADALLEQFGAQGKVESQMLDQLGASVPLLHPDRFEEAHRTAMRALEVFDRNAGRSPSNLNVGPLTPLAALIVQRIIRIVVRSYQTTVINSIRELYTQRQATTVKGSTEFVMLRIARRDAERLAPTLTKKSGGLPAFLVGGAVLSGATSLLQAAFDNAIILLLVAAAYTLLALAAFWCVLKAAALARRRTRIALDQPLRALWETIGSAGSPATRREPPVRDLCRVVASDGLDHRPGCARPHDLPAHRLGAHQEAAAPTLDERVCVQPNRSMTTGSTALLTSRRSGAREVIQSTDPSSGSLSARSTTAASSRRPGA